MPPPKVKLHKNSGKARMTSKVPQMNTPVNNAQPSTSSASVNPVTGLPTEQELQFQSELYWCIQQFQKALSSGKLPTKQVQDHTKALNTLMSNTAPIAKKRQVMRLSFGDYRSKMLEDEKKAKKMSIKIGSGKPSEKSVFFKKAIITSTGNAFKFNFPTPDSNTMDGDLSNETPEDKLNSTSPIVNKAIFAKSDNSFRFNFASESGEDVNNTNNVF